MNDVGGDRRWDVGVSGSLAALGFAAAALSWRMENPLQQAIGPGYVPAIVSVCLAVLALGQTASALLRRPGVAGLELSPSLRWMAAAALLAGAVWVWSVGGYLAGIFSAVFGIMLIDRKVKLQGTLPFAVLLSGSLWVLFHIIFKIDLG